MQTKVQLAVFAATAVMATSRTYDPSDRTDPFDTAANTVSALLTNPEALPDHMDTWGTSFCSCVQNGYIASWYQYASMMYLVDTCTKEDGFVMRTGHLQQRHTEPLQAMMSCDALKLITYCLKMHAEEALGRWNSSCREAHYSVAACDVDCSAAVPRAGGRSGAMVALLGAVAMAVITSLGAF